MAFDDDDHYYDEPFSNNGKNSNSFNSKIMIAAIVSLIVVVVLIIILHIYGRCVLRRRAQRRRAMTIHRLTVAVAAQAHSSDQPTKGLDPAVISSFPSFPFKNTIQSDALSAIDCAVCLSELEEGDMVRALPNCKHSFHTDCIDAWLISHTNCPVCRTEAEPRVQPAVETTVEPTAPPVGPSCREGSSDCGVVLHNAKPEMSSSSRLSSFRRMLTGERSSRRIQPSVPDEESTTTDIERQ